MATNKVHEWVKPFCTKQRGADGILDGVNVEWYLRFDCDVDSESAIDNTVDVLLVPVGEPPRCERASRIMRNANRRDLLWLLLSLRLWPLVPEPIKGELCELLKTADSLFPPTTEGSTHEQGTEA